MTTDHKKNGTIAHPKPLFQRWLLNISVLTAICWLLLQKGCVLTPDISRAHTFPDTETAATQPAFVAVGTGEGALPRLPLANSPATGGEKGPHSQPLRHASDLLRKAAAMLDKNDRTAIRLILQAIAILKHEVMQGIDAPEYDHVSTLPASSQNHRLLWKARTMAPVVPEPFLSLFKTPTETHDAPHRSDSRSLFCDWERIMDLLEQE